jgi:para-nitrobenzyl esterase
VHEWIARNGGEIYAYEFNENDSPVFKFAPPRLHSGQVFPLGAYHGSQLQYLFKMPPVISCDRRYPGLRPAQDDLQDAMLDYWASFAKTGNPKKPVLPVRIGRSLRLPTGNCFRWTRRGRA